MVDFLDISAWCGVDIIQFWGWVSCLFSAWRVLSALLYGFAGFWCLYLVVLVVLDDAGLTCQVVLLGGVLGGLAVGSAWLGV